MKRIGPIGPLNGLKWRIFMRSSLRSSLLFSGSLALAIAAGAAWAQTTTGTAGTTATTGEDQSQRVEEMFKRIDTDGDGMISKAEMENWRDNVVFALDANHDGKVTRAEVEQGVAPDTNPQDIAAFFERYDANNDGAIDKAELKNGGDARFQTADSNSDGELSIEEWRAMNGS